MKLLNAIKYLTGALILAPIMAMALPAYTYTNGVNTGVFDPISSNQTAESYYNLNVGSGHPAFGTTSNTGYLWLYQNTSNNDVSLGMIFDTVNDASPGQVMMFSLGMPLTAALSLSDGVDPLSDLEADGSASWSFDGCCTDGAVYSGFNGEWDFGLYLIDSTGIDNWFLLDGPNAASPNKIALDIGSFIQLTAIDPQVNPPGTVPEPTALALLGAGIVGLSLVRRKKL